MKNFVFVGPFRDQGMPDFIGKLKDEDVVKIRPSSSVPPTRSVRRSDDRHSGAMPMHQPGMTSK
jgi:hypothetical protein